jgi:hypothetical protein
MRKIFKPVLIFLFFIFLLQSFLINVYKLLVMPSSHCKEETNYLQSDLGSFIEHKRSWTNARSPSGFCMNYAVFEKNMNSSNTFREAINPTSNDFYYEYWGDIYKSLHELNKNDLSTIQDSLIMLKEIKDMSRSEFAYLIVSFVQDIPYSFIKSESCDDVKKGDLCKGDAKFGILSPIEFLYTLHGDCDTRTVLLYSLLSNFGYNPLILVSHEYLHSMLALEIPSSGEFLLHKGRKFYFWETTNTGWEPGMIAPDMKNKNYWNIALDYEY